MDSGSSDVWCVVQCSLLAVVYPITCCSFDVLYQQVDLQRQAAGQILYPYSYRQQ